MSDECTCPQCADDLPDTPETREAFNRGFDAGYLAREAGLFLDTTADVEYVTAETFEAFALEVLSTVEALADASEIISDAVEIVAEAVDETDLRARLAMTGAGVALKTLAGLNA